MVAGQDQRVVVIGLPEVGKTTFLAALWDVVGSGEVPGALQLAQLEGDKHHLNEIRDRWADWEAIDRTKVPNETMVSMWLKEIVSGRVSEVIFTDMSGESFQQQWNERVCTPEYCALISQISGALLFIHPRQVMEAVLIRDAATMMRRLPSPSPSSVDDPGASALKPSAGRSAAPVGPAEVETANPLPTEPRYASTQVQLVELLQFVNVLRSSNTDKLRLGVILSAWDVVEKQSKGNNAGPRSWLSERMPLLDQFLRANPELFDYDVFGVSAQGGELDQAEELRKMSHQPSDRIIVIHGAQRSHDITVPVRWVLRFDSNAAANSSP